jgi:hypothetical protein
MFAMCRNITALHGLAPPATAEEIFEASRQYVRKVSGVRAPSPRNEAAFNRAIEEIAAATTVLLAELPARKQPPTTEPPLRRLARQATQT